MALKLKGSTSGFVGLDAPPVAGNNTLILPNSAGSAHQILANDITAGVTTFTQVTISRNGDLTVPGTISIGGTLTYEDVTSVDSVGIVTARGLSIFGNTTGLQVASGISTFQAVTGTTGSFTGNLTVSNAEPTLNLTDTNNNSDFAVRNNDGVFGIRDTTNSVERLQIDSNGQLGLGVLPDTWSTGNSITVGTAQGTLWGVSDQINLSGNAYFNSGWKAAATKAGASQIQQALGKIDFKVSGSVTADAAITWTDAVSILNSGAIVKGTSSTSYDVDIVGTDKTVEIGVEDNSSNYRVALNTTNNVNADFNIQHKSNLTSIGTGVNKPFCFHVNGGTDASSAEKMRIDTSGRLLIGHSSSQHSTSMLQISRANNCTIRVANSDATATNYAALDLAPANSIAGASIQAKAIGTFANTSSQTADLLFNTRHAGTTSEKFRITSDGLFGFGTDDPQAFIEVKSIDGSDTFDALRLINTHADSSYANSTKLKLGITNAGGEKVTSIRAYQESAAGNAVSLSFWTNSSGSNDGDTEKMQLTGDSGIEIKNYASGNILKYGGSQIQPNAAINMYRGGNQYCNISIGSNYGAGLYISGANNNQSDLLVLQQDNSKNAYLSNRSTNPIYFQTSTSNTTRVAIRHSGAAMVDVYGEAAYDDSSSGARGVDLSYSGSQSCPVYFGTEHDAAQKSMYMSGYYIILRGHQNEGIKFRFSQSSGAPRSDTYTFKYNSAVRPGGNTWDGFSDERAKENVVSITNGIELIKKLRPVTFDWTNDYADSQTMYIMGRDENGTIAKKENGYDPNMKNGKYGFIAQEFETVFPKDVKTSEYKLGETEISDFKTINQDSLIPTLTAALKEAVARIETLESEVAALKGS